MRTTIRRTVVATLVIATVLTIGLATALQYYFGSVMAQQAAADHYATASSGVAAQLSSITRNNDNVVQLLADSSDVDLADPLGDNLQTFVEVLRNNPLYHSIYLGNEQGHFFEVVNLESGGEMRRLLRAESQDRWLVSLISLVDGELVREFRYLDERLRMRTSRTEATGFDVRDRNWYTSAMASDGLQRSAPYTFAQLGLTGSTISRRIDQSGTVVAVDMTLSRISDFLRELRVSDQGEIFIFTGEGKIFAASTETTVASQATGSQPDTEESLARLVAQPATHGRLTEARFRGRNALAYVRPVSSDDQPIYLGIITSRHVLLAPYLEKVKLSIGITVLFLLLLLPLSWFIANPIVRPIKQLSVENDKVQRREFEHVKRVNSSIGEIDELSESMLNMVSAIQAHEVAREQLLDSIIKLIAEAIDDKSSYTGGHCERVPEIALMLAEQASQSEDSAFAGFRLESEEEWREFRIAAWLHDCGKITTPEHIVDKGTKLETIYNRLHEIRTRFEVLWRDAEIAYWQGRSESPEREAELAQTLAGKRRELTDNFSFIAECNVGGEFLDQEQLDRLHRIGDITWQRHFDDRIGLSPVEESNLGATPGPLPATERLLADRDEHLIERERAAVYPAELGINMEIPQYLANLGELYNLSIARGTLTTEDRFRINEHMISTIKMLDGLPFPDDLKNVPRYASTHHETMKGSGYPRKLTGPELSIPERILAIADIFEALTATDRPYKRGKPLSEALQIMHRMALDNHIDKDCFQLFVSSGVYRRYAQAFLSPDQVDEVPEKEYLSA